MKTIKFFIPVLFLLFLTSNIWAQSDMQDVVYLKNGSIIKGSIIEIVPDKYIKIEVLGGSIYVYTMNEIEKCVKEQNTNSTQIIQEEVVVEKQVISKPTPLVQQNQSADNEDVGVKKGYFGGFEFGEGISFGELEGPLRIKLSILNGYRINPYLALGVGFGLRAYPGETAFMPFYFHVRTNFLNKRTSPYFSLDLGYAFTTHSNYKGGMLFSPTFGVSKRLKNRTSLNLGLSYELQRFSYNYYYYDYYYYPVYYTQNDFAHTVSFMFGITF
jgi:hypothetical protein